MSEETFADYLARLSEADLTALLELRPEVRVEPVPRGFGELAQRLDGAESLAAALRVINRDTAVVSQAVAGLGEDATVPAIANQLRAPEQLVRDGVDDLFARGLAWPSGDTIRLPERLEAHWSAEFSGHRPFRNIAKQALAAQLQEMGRALGVEVDGLRKPELIEAIAQLLSDRDRLAPIIGALPRSAREMLCTLRRNQHGYFAYHGRNPRSGLVEALVSSGLVLKVNYKEELPREVAVTSWLMEAGVELTGRPTLPPAEVPDERAEQAAAQAALLALTTLLDDTRSAPMVALKKGGVGPRERKRLAGRLGFTDEELVLWIDLAHAAGLLALTKGGYAPTAEYTHWRDAEPGQRWAAIADAWFALEYAPTSRETSEDKEIPPPLALGSWAGAVRRAMLRAAHDGAAVRAAGEAVDWFCPFHEYPAAYRETKVAAAIREAELLGVVAGDAVSGLGRCLLDAAALAPEDRVAELAKRVEASLPAAHGSVILQSDMTAVVSGQPSASTSKLLNEAAVAEARGAAGTWRFTPTSVRAALDAGWTADDLLAELAKISTRPVPQPLEYLINDVARRHGQVRVRGVRSCVVADEASVSEILHTKAVRKLHLGPIAPTVLGSPMELDKVLAELREAGFAPVAEDAEGEAIVEVRREHEASPVRPVAARRKRERLTSAELAQRLLADPRGAQATLFASDTFAELRALNRRLSDAEVRILADAVEAQGDIAISYRNKDGNRTFREIQPQTLYGRWLDSWCYLRDGQREFTVANIESVSPV